jgi:hypothetical protein
MNNIEQEVLDMVKSTNERYHVDYHPSLMRLIELITIYGWKVMIPHIENPVTDGVVSIHGIYCVLCEVQKLSMGTQIPTDVAFEFTLHDPNTIVSANKLLFVRALDFAKSSKNGHGSYFLSRLVHDDKAKSYIVDYSRF